MPTPRMLDEDPQEQAIIEEMRTDVEFDQWNVRGYVSNELDRVMPVVLQILSEGDALLGLNPSASVVWSVQALEFFLKSGILRPAFRYRLSFDTHLADQVFKDLIDRNGSYEAKKWLNRLFGLNVPELLMETRRGNIWSELWREPRKDTKEALYETSLPIVEWRNKIIHGAYMATEPEARNALQTVKEFVEAIYSLLHSARVDIS
jgi:hypothetical protein